MLRNALAGKAPDYTVPNGVKAIPLDRLEEIYRKMCIDINVLILDNVKRKLKTDPKFDINNANDFKLAIR